MSINFSDLQIEVKGIKVDPKLFTFKFSCLCNGECCHYGVYADLKEYERIISIKDEIVELMDETQSTVVKDWFEDPIEDSDFDSGVAVGTQLVNGKCSFLDKAGLCVLQKLAMKKNLNKWEYKPYYCILFPLTIYEGILTIDDEHIDRLKYCNKYPVNGESIFEQCKEEIIFIFGEDGYETLLNHKKEILEKFNSSKENEA